MKAKILSPTFRSDDQGRVRRGGYYFRLQIDPLGWEAFAWPDEEERSVARSFWIDAEGDMFAHAGFATDHPPTAKDGSWKPVG